MYRLHITGSGPRTGTTLLMEMMIACFEIDWYPEHEASVYRIPDASARIALTKAPHESALAERALEEMNDLYIIYVLRDPRDMVASKHGLAPDQYWVGLNFWKCLSPYGRKLKNHPRFTMVRYEELVRRPDSVQSVLSARMGFLKTKLHFSDYHQAAMPRDPALKAMGGVRRPTDISIGNWRKHLPRIAGQLKRHGEITTDLLEFGFENDARWDKVLAGVPPDIRRSYLPDEWGVNEICPGRIPEWLLH